MNPTMRPEHVSVELSAHLEGEWIMLRGEADNGVTWTVTLSPSRAVKLSLALAHFAGLIEGSKEQES
jgi:hypothetical protein